MATNIVTSDGKDLDSRYLGISAKAASAKTADSVSYSNVSGKPSGLSFGGNYTWNKTGSANTTITFTAPSNVCGLVSARCEPSYASGVSKLKLVINGKTIVDKQSTAGVTASQQYVFLKKGQTVIATYTKVSGEASAELNVSGAIWAFS